MPRFLGYMFMPDLQLLHTTWLCSFLEIWFIACTLLLLWLLHTFLFLFITFFSGNSADVAFPQLGRNPALRQRQILGSPTQKIQPTLSHWAPKGNAGTVWHSRECTKFSSALIAKAWGSESARSWVLLSAMDVQQMRKPQLECPFLVLALPCQ